MNHLHQSTVRFEFEYDFFFKENAYEIAICKTVAIVFRPQCNKENFPVVATPLTSRPFILYQFWHTDV